ncbi:MAG: LpxL/LpxP family Kdo(2)-lipid IV(A) lauroyl/palmitoleoyl acyltransferase [Enterovibrio sp.]
MKQTPQVPHFRLAFLHPRYWHTWFALGLMYLISWLPYRLQRFLGFKLGMLLMRVLKSRKKIAARNLQLCFPNLSAAERETLLHDNFKHMGLSLFETGMAWFWPDWRVKKHVRYVGFEQIETLRKNNSGVLLIAIHSLNLELGARAFGLVHQGFGVFRPNTNPVYNWVQYHGRTRGNQLIDRIDVKQMIRVLREGCFVWYAPDHDYGKHRHAFVPLFAVEDACTTTGTQLLASASRCQVASFTITRDKAGSGYTLTLDAKQEDFPTHDPAVTAQFTNKIIERSILRAPEQYMWLHRRFKSRPDGKASYYD